MGVATADYSMPEENEETFQLDTERCREDCDGAEVCDCPAGEFSTGGCWSGICTCGNGYVEFSDRRCHPFSSTIPHHYFYMRERVRASKIHFQITQNLSISQGIRNALLCARQK